MLWNSPMPFLVLDKLTKRYDTFYAVRELSLAVEQGEFIALLGPSGCGKTTTLQMIAGFVHPTSGGIELEGRDLVSVKPAKRGLGIVFQSYALFPHMTAAENIGFGLDMQGIGRAERDQRVKYALNLVGLATLAHRFPRRMSGGQQQRVALARALVIKPRILLLDEPLSNLDAKLREEMQIELRQIQRTLGTTTILVTHDQGEAMALADRIVVMNRGCVEQIGPPHETYEWPATPFVAEFLGKTNLLDGIGDAAKGMVAIDGLTWTADSPPNGPVQISIRPEKVHFSVKGARGLPAKVRTRIFQGHHWLYQVDAGGRLITITHLNAGGAMPAEGDEVLLDWHAADMRVRVPGSGA
jgi:putative spermidine/putrescine transport system ATP-binding protein